MKKRVFKRMGSLAVAGMMFVCYPLAASASQYDISQGNISVLASFENGQTKYKVNGNDVDGTEIEITGYNGRNGVYHYVEITSGDGASALIRFKDLYIDNSTVDDGFAVITGGDGKVEIELDGDNTLKAGDNRAGLQKENAGLLVIKDADGTAGKLAATGGSRGAGIGGGDDQSVDNIVIEGGTITATGGNHGAGIGGGYNGSGTVTISRGTVEATGGNFGVGIGGGIYGSGTVTINGGDVTATGGDHGAGIGGGISGSGTVTISGGNVAAIGGACGAGIGGDSVSNGLTITVSGPANVSACGGDEGGLWNLGPGAAIGEGGKNGDLGRVQGDTVTPDVSGLYTTGSVTTYAVGTPLDAIKQGTSSGTTIVGTVPDPNANTNTTTPEEPKANEPKAEEPKKEEPKGEEPETEEPPVYTERSCIADVDVAALVGALLSSNASATTLDIDFEDNICLSPEIMTALFADNRVAKNCFFWHKGKRYVLHIGAVNKQSALYTEDFAELAEEPDGLAGFMMMAKIFANLGVTLNEIQE
ncbi:MAG: hypothetical protein K6A97_00380 [Lachnospiraceae bacterium]|nr:hypothetical protein [Lachnospiraceae bacterium]